MKIEDINDEDWREIEADCIAHVKPMLHRLLAIVFVFGIITDEVVRQLLGYIQW